MELFTLVAAVLALVPATMAQTPSSVGCLRLLGSVACPAFQYAYLSPSNLSNAFPFFESVTDVASFDSAALGYFSNPAQFATTKFIDQLGCSNASSATIRYQRTVLCSMWVNERWSEQCLAFYNGTSAATSQKMVCQQTCLDYSASEKAIVNSTEYCPGPDLTNGNRSYQLNKDFVDCTNWTTLATKDTQTCITGEMNNDVNCGFASSTQELCAFCNHPQPADCCYAGSTDVSVCGYVLPARASSTSSGTSATSSASPSSSVASGQDSSGSSSSSSNKLSGGQIAGIVVGSVIGGLLLLAALILLFLCCRRRNNKSSQARHQPNNSEKGLVGGSPGANTNSTPTFLDGNTVYAGSGHAKSADSGLLHPNTGGTGLGLAPAGVGAGAAAAAAGAERGGIVLPRVRDENQNDERFIETGAEVTVLWPYTATLPDELDLRPGMKIRVLRLYDDAWGTGQVGAFPIVCVSEGSSFGSVSHGSHESSELH